tara:strand:+ start:21477 stop:21704 length:228 start_codon:yes stop_codon:yes gene_type:complete
MSILSAIMALTALNCICIIFFSYYLNKTFEKEADNLKKDREKEYNKWNYINNKLNQGGFIPGVRPGSKTADTKTL